MARILVMDDQERNLLAAEALLRMPGREVVRVSTAKAAIEEVQRSDFTVAVLDVVMPRGGLETARALRLIDPDLPIILVTALANDSHVVRAVHRLGPVWCMGKPVDPKLLGAAIARAEALR
jgi:CheY-like chemotaxis protein